MTWSLSDPETPSTAIVSTANAKAHLRVTGTADDTYIAALVTAATMLAQRYTGRLLYSQTITEYHDSFPATRDLQLHVYPIDEVTVRYRNSSDVLTTMDSDDYWTHLYNRPAVIEAKSTWPSTENRLGAVEKVVPRADLEAEARTFCAVIASKSRKALVIAKEALNGLEPRDVDRGYRWEQGFTLEMYMHEDSQKARDAFVETGKAAEF